MHGQFHFCRRVTLFLPFPRVLRFSPSRSLSYSLLSSLARSRYSSSLRGNFFDKLFSTFFAGGCKLNPSWRLAQARLSWLPLGSRPYISPRSSRRASRPFSTSDIPRNPLRPREPSQADTKPIRAKRWEHYHIAFFAEIRAARACLGSHAQHACAAYTRESHTRPRENLPNRRDEKRWRPSRWLAWGRRWLWRGEEGETGWVQQMGWHWRWTWRNGLPVAVSRV